MYVLVIFNSIILKTVIYTVGSLAAGTVQAQNFYVVSYEVFARDEIVINKTGEFSTFFVCIGNLTKRS